MVLITKLFFFQTIRYFILGGGAYLLLNHWAKKYFQKYRIQDSLISKNQLLNEIKYSLSTIFLFSVFFSIILNPSLNSYFKIYSTFNQYPTWWNVLSGPLLVFIHDTYFYWMHRTLHHRIFFKKFHRTHHLSTNPTPFASFSFHPYEAFLETIWLLPILMIVPVHKYIFIAFAFISFLNNLKGHLGYEFSRGRISLLNTSTHHSLHHRYFNSNYGLYLLFWDRVCKTERKTDENILSSDSFNHI